MASLATPELLVQLKHLAEVEGLHPGDTRPDTLKAEKEIPLGKWFFGGRKALYAMACVLDEAAHDVAFREVTTETSWGVPPPSLKFTTTTQSGTRVNEKTSVKTPVGDGSFDIGHFRSEVEAAVEKAGWHFHLEPGRRP